MRYWATAAVIVVVWVLGILGARSIHERAYDQGYCEGYLDAVASTSSNPDAHGGDPVEAGICPPGWDD